MRRLTTSLRPERKHAKTADGLAIEFSIPNLHELIRRFLYFELAHDRAALPSGSSLPLDLCPVFSDEHILVHYSATATFYAPSDPSGIGGMRREVVRANPGWRGKHPRFDCVFVNKSNDKPGFLGMNVARVRLFFSFTYRGRRFPCAAVQWYRRTQEDVNEDTGMWIVEPSFI